jgi:hypothetical protein
MTAHASIVYFGQNSHVVELQDLRDVDGVLQTTATVTLVTIVRYGTTIPVSGLSFPYSMPHIGSGNYRVALPVTSGFLNGQRYEATIRAVAGSSAGEWTETIAVQLRRA